MSTSIPAFHVSDLSRVEGSGEVYIASRKDAVSTGVFAVKLSVHFDPAVDNYPTGTLSIRSDLSDGAHGIFTATSIELINSYGKHSPTVYLTGRINGDVKSDTAAHGLRYWLLIANNKNRADEKGTPDIVGFAVHDHKGDRIAYGTGPLRSGDFIVASK